MSGCMGMSRSMRSSSSSRRRRCGLAGGAGCSANLAKRDSICSTIAPARASPRGDAARSSLAAGRMAPRARDSSASVLVDPGWATPGLVASLSRGVSTRLSSAARGRTGEFSASERGEEGSVSKSRVAPRSFESGAGEGAGAARGPSARGRAAAIATFCEPLRFLVTSGIAGSLERSFFASDSSRAGGAACGPGVGALAAPSDTILSVLIELLRRASGGGSTIG